VKIALLGTRGIPANYGGFETCVEQLGARLAARGHEVTVYCRSPHIAYEGKTYRGMRLLRLPTIRHKYLDTFVHTFRASLHALFQPYDICLYFIAGNSPLCWIPRLTGKRTIIHVDGLDWQREKWPPLAKKYIRMAEWLATVLPNALLTDSATVQKYYLDTYHIEVPYILYGAEVEPLSPGPTLQQWGLEPNKYILFVGRLVPENRVHHLLDAFHTLDNTRGMKCVIVGDAAYADAYVAQLKARHYPDVIFTGYLFGDGYRELSSNAYCFVETSAAGGTHPALVEAMGFGSCVVTNDASWNLETVGPVGLSYAGHVGVPSLKRVLQQLLDKPSLVAEQRALARAYAAERYSWETIADQYLDLFQRVLSHPLPRQAVDLSTDMNVWR
jgi:glycosyltransferase involved in cell wall biosynthesis